MSLSQLSQLLPLPEDELQQVLDYAGTLPKPEAAEHFRNLLGDSPAAIEFISTFNGKRHDPASPSPSSAIEPVPKGGGKKKKKAPLHTLAPRAVEDFGPAGGTAYNKKGQEDDYIVRKPGLGSGAPSQPLSRNNSQPGSGTNTPPSKQQRTAAGYLISDAKPKSSPASRASSPKPASAKPPPTKVTVTGGTPMAGASTALTDLDAAIRSLEISTNPSLDNVAARRCNCNASRHPLQTAAPNCLSCGKIICVKEGLAPCTYCGTPLLSSGEVQGMIRELRVERGKEKMAADKEAHRRPEVSRSPAPFAQHREDERLAEAEAQALAHRDRLLSFQAQNAQRTTVRDEAADFDVTAAMSGAGGSMWSTPEERARELKRQQKLLREMEWNARPEYEKRRQVVSIDLVGGKVVKKMAAAERPHAPESDHGDEADVSVLEETDGNAARTASGGGFSKNPLLGGLIKPVYDAKGKGKGLEGRGSKTRWRRVQDEGDNEAVILDGGVHGHASPEIVVTAAAGDEPACG